MQRYDTAGIKKQRIVVNVLIGTFTLVLFTLLFQNSFYYNFAQPYYITIHLIAELFIIYFSLAIAVQTWLGSNFLPDNRRIVFGALFLSMGIFETVHLLSYSGMPYFITDVNPNLSLWFTTMQRMLLPVGIIVIYGLSFNLTRLIRPNFIFFTSMMVSIFIIYSSYVWIDQLPVLIDSTGQATTLRTILHGLLLGLEVLSIYIVVLKKREIHFKASHIISAIGLMMLCELSLLNYARFYDVYIFIAHIFHLAAFIVLFFAIYSSQVKRPFIALKDAHEKLERSQKELKEIAYFDKDTGFENDYSLKEMLQNELSKKQVTLFMISIHRFSTYRATLGKSQVQYLLKSVGHRIASALNEEATVFKYDSERFAVYISKELDELEIRKLATSIRQALSKPYVLNHFSLSISVHIGIATYPKHATNEEQLMQHAFFALLEAEQTAKPYVLYNEQLQIDMDNRIRLEQDLKQAVHDQLYMEYQPKMDLKTGEILSVEALVRWKHPEKGLISPLEFIPIAEESGLIIPIGDWIIETACREILDLQKAVNRQIVVAINLSVAQVIEQSFIDKVKQVIHETKIHPEQLQFEITESMTVNMNQVIPILNELKQLGVSIAIDDFGTGYSSLAYLKNFPIDVLKIDRSFIRNLLEDEKDTALVNTILSMAQHLQLKVVAEGVEHLHQLKYLAEHDCDKAQGYLISKPQNVTWLKKNLLAIQKETYEQLESIHSVN